MRTVETLASGRYKVRFRHNGRQSSETFDRRRDAVDFTKWLDALGPQGALDHLYESERPSGAPSLDQMAADHIEHMTGVTSGYRITSQRLWARTWSPLIGTVPANQVGRDDIARALNQLAEHYSPKSLKNQRGLLFGVLDRCIEHGHLASNPAKKVRLPQGRVRALDDDEDEEGEKVFLRLEEFASLYWATREHYQPLVRFLAGTGCRWGEAVVLRVSDVVLTGIPAVRIRRALKWSPDGKYTIGAPKTKKSRRTVTIGPALVADLTRLVEGKGPRDLVFTAPRGGMIKHRTFWEEHWRPAIWRAQHCPRHTDPSCLCGSTHPERCTLHQTPPPPCGCAGTLTRTPRIHDLRHSHASWLLEKHQIQVVQARLGHESIQTTVDTYGHLLPDVQVAAASAADLDFGTPALPLPESDSDDG